MNASKARDVGELINGFSPTGSSHAYSFEYFNDFTIFGASASESWNAWMWAGRLRDGSAMTGWIFIIIVIIQNNDLIFFVGVGNQNFENKVCYALPHHRNEC